MTQAFTLVAPRFVPPLDPGFRPAALANRAFRREVEQSGVGVPLMLRPGTGRRLAVPL